jgi:hypothetical protein
MAGSGRVGRILRRASAVLAVLLVGLPVAIELVYQGVIATLPPIPVPPDPPPAPGLQLMPLWEHLGGEDSMEIQPLYSWRALRLLPFERGLVL